ncbi:hypothetical protein HHX47_DHR9000099 [Lentinula edodes]|nr:hypothetical protein HHX47_DHR9000099 [Lentinula edodes]
MTPFPALPGFYRLLFLYFEPGYMLLGLISSLVFRAVRDALRGNPVAQERIIGSALTALAIADVSLS